MELQIDRDEFNRALYRAQGIVEKKNTMPILASVLLEATTVEGAAGAAGGRLKVSAFDLEIGGAGRFPPAGRPRALWLGVPVGTEALAGLAAEVERALVAAGWPPETRPFRAHLTLARSDGVAAGASIGDRLRELAAEFRIGARVERIGLFESLTGGGPARYDPIELVELGSREVPV